MNIKPVNRKNRGNRYCGPAAISIINGCNTDDAAKLIRVYNGKRPVKGAFTSHVLKVLNDIGYNCYNVRFEGGTTLAGWLRATHGERGGKVFLVVAGKHFQVISGNRFCCARTGEIVGLKHDMVKRRARVKRVIRVEASADALRHVDDVIKEHYPRDEYEVKRKKIEASAGAKARRLAKLWDIEIETEVWGQGSDRYTRIMVWGPDFIDDLDTDEVDPYSGYHYAEDWQDALERVETYVKLLEDKPHLFERNANQVN